MSEHPIEPEIAGVPPRTVRLPWRTRALLTLASAMAVLLFLGGLRALLEAGRLAWTGAFGRTITARVTEVRTDAGPPAVPVGLRYTYADPFTGERRSQFVRLDPEPARDMDAGAPERRIPSRPSVAPMVHVGDSLPLRIARWGGHRTADFWGPAPWNKGIFLSLCGLVVMGVGVGLLRTLARWRRQRAFLLSQGQAVVGTVIHKHAEAADMPRYYVRYGYATLPAGETQEHEEQVSPEQWKRFEVGQPVTVLYDPGHPTQAGLYALIRHG